MSDGYNNPQGGRNSDKRKDRNAYVQNEGAGYNSQYGDAYDDYQDNYQDDSVEYEDIYSASQTDSVPVKKKANKRLLLNVVIISLALIMGIVGSGMVYVYAMLDRIDYQAGDTNSYGVNAGALTDSNATTNSDYETVTSLPPVSYTGQLVSDPMVQNILLIGADRNDNGADGRSDSMILLSIDNRHHKLKMTSIMRDTYVHIPGIQDNRINTAYAYGGPVLTMETIERNFGIAVDRYVIVDFASFAQIVDRLGGVDIELTKGEADLVNQYADVPNSQRTLKAGVQHLNGPQALYYSRIRAIGSDFERTQRQRTVLTSMVNKFKSSNIGTINGILYDVVHMITTNLSKDEILNLAGNSLKYMNYPMSQFRMPADNTWQGVNIRGMSVLVVDMDKNRELYKNFIFEDALNTAVSTASKK